MKTYKLALLAGVALFSLSTAAHAEIIDYRGFYVGGFGGLVDPNAHEVDAYNDNTHTTRPTSAIEYNLGYAVGAEAGWSMGNGLMLGGEYTYRRFDVDNTDDGSTTLTKNGGVTAHSFLMNATYNLPVEFFGIARPYAGGGIGPAYIQYKNIGLGGGEPGASLDDNKWALAYQAFVGLGWSLTPRLALTTEYRYMATGENTADVKNDLPFANKTKADIGTHNFLAGLKYQFGEPVAQPAPAPAPMPMPAPAPMVRAPAPAPVAAAPAPVVQQTYIVFFDFDKSDLTPEAHKVLERAAQDVRVGKGVKIQVIGHTDRAGSNRYNQRLSERRASVVKNELVNLGVPNEQISARGVGETEPRVPTADGVREAQNRRAEIIFQ